MLHTITEVGFYRCPVCNRRHSESLMNLTPDLFMGWALCAEDEAMFERGYVALVEIEGELEARTVAGQIEEAEPLRTGNAFHVLRERWPSLFTTPEPPHFFPMVFIAPKAAAEMVEQNRLTLH